MFKGLAGFIALFAFALGASNTRAADNLDGLFLKELCQNDQNTFDSSVCYAFLNGFRQHNEMTLGYLIAYGMRTGVSHQDFKSIIFCAPDNSGNKQLALVYVKWANENPEKLHDPMGFAALNALREAFPCDQNAIEQIKSKHIK